VAANIDTVFLVSGLDQNFNPKRIQRFLVAAKESGAEAVIVLNKSDVCDDAEAVKKEIEVLVPGVPVFITSTETRKGLKALTAAYARPGRMLAFIGSSGVGKSSLINLLVKDPEALPTGEVREKDSKGRHTTTRRELVPTPAGALVIDTPGCASCSSGCRGRRGGCVRGRRGVCGAVQVWQLRAHERAGVRGAGGVGSGRTASAAIRKLREIEGRKGGERAGAEETECAGEQAGLEEPDAGRRRSGIGIMWRSEVGSQQRGRWAGQGIGEGGDD